MSEVNFLDIKPGDLVLTDISSEWLPVTEVYITAVQVQTEDGGTRPAYNDPTNSWSPSGGVKIVGLRKARK